MKNELLTINPNVLMETVEKYAIAAVNSYLDEKFGARAQFIEQHRYCGKDELEAIIPIGKQQMSNKRRMLKPKKLNGKNQYDLEYIKQYYPTQVESYYRKKMMELVSPIFN